MILSILEYYRGGQAINVVPDRCKIIFDIRPTTKKEAVKDFVNNTIQRLKIEDPDFKIESINILNDKQTGGIGPEHEFVKLIQRVTKWVKLQRPLPVINNF